MVESQAKITHLAAALKHYQLEFNSSAYRTMGFSVVVVGWLMTSKEARDFILHTHWVGWTAICLLIIATAGYSWMAWGVRGLSQRLYDNVKAVDQDATIFEPYRLTPVGVGAYIGMQVFASAFIIALILAAMYSRIS